MKRTLPYPLALLAGAVLLAVVIAWVRSPDEAYVADVNGDRITAETWRTAYVDYLASTGLQDAPARRTGFLDRLIGVKLVVADARARGFAEKPPVAASIRRAEEKLKLDYYVHRLALDSIEVTEGEMREMFLRMNTQVNARHLYAASLEGAKVLRQRLEGGETFEALAHEVFHDPKLAENGGSLGWFGFDEMDPGFEDVAFTLPVGTVSDPVRTSLGYSIIRVDDRQPKPLITESEYAAASTRIRRYVLHRRQSAAKTALVEDILDDIHVAFHADGFEMLVGVVEGTVEMAGETPSADLLSEPLVSYDFGGERRTWTIADFRENAQRTSPEQRAAVTSGDYLRQFVSGLLAREEMLRAFEESDWEGEAEFQSVRRAALDDVVYEFAYNDLMQSLADSLRLTGDTLMVDLHRREFLRERVAALRSEASITVRPDLLATIELR